MAWPQVTLCSTGTPHLLSGGSGNGEQTIGRRLLNKTKLLYFWVWITSFNIFFLDASILLHISCGLHSEGLRMLMAKQQKTEVQAF